MMDESAVEMRLPESVREKASVYLGEWAWRTADVPEAIEAAAGVGLAVVLGDPRVMLPQGPYELPAPTVDEDDEDLQRPGESWGAFVERSAHEARRALERLVRDRSWLAGEPNAPKDLLELEWVLYFLTPPGR